jgi:WhiB family redox-sensing transcriptional regulator
VIAREEIPAWVSQGVCGQVDPELFFPEKGGSTKEAKLVCRSCPVKAECLAFALEHDVRFGVWGGMSERERRALKPERVAA